MGRKMLKRVVILFFLLILGILLSGALSSAQAAVVEPAVAYDASGNFYVTWASGTSEWAHDIYLQKFNPSGIPQWSGAKRVNVTASSPEYNLPDIAVSSNGALIYVAWVKGTKVYLQKFNGSGVRQWSTDKIIVNDSGNYRKQKVALALDTSGYLYSGHSNQYLSAGGTTITVKKFDANGALKWSKQANKNTSFDSRWNADIAVQGSYVYTTWETVSTTDKIDVFLMKLRTSDGALLYSSDKLISNSSSVYDTNKVPALAADAKNTLYIVWQYQYGSTWIADVKMRTLNLSNDSLSAIKWVGASYPTVLADISVAAYYRSDAAKSFAYVAWIKDIPNGALGVFVQRVDSTGTRYWPSIENPSEIRISGSEMAQYPGVAIDLRSSSFGQPYFIWTASSNLWGEKRKTDGTKLWSLKLY